MSRQAMTANCPDCTGGLAHCHGAMVDHLDGAVECTEPACADLATARHSLRGDCADLLAGCACTELAEPVVLPRAS